MLRTCIKKKSDGYHRVNHSLLFLFRKMDKCFGDGAIIIKGRSIDFGMTSNES